MGSDPGIMFDTYLWSTLCYHAMMEPFVKHKFDDHPAMYEDTTQLTVCNYPSNPTSKLKVDLEKLKSLSTQVKFLSEDLTKVKIIKNYMYNMVSKLKDVIS